MIDRLPSYQSPDRRQGIFFYVEHLPDSWTRKSAEECSQICNSLRAMKRLGIPSRREMSFSFETPTIPDNTAENKIPPEQILLIDLMEMLHLATMGVTINDYKPG